VKLLRRSSSPADDVLDHTTEDDVVEEPAATHTTPKKGRPTPKRREAEGKRLGPVPPPPRTRREAARRLRDRNSEQRARTRAGMRAGDDNFLPVRDRGPARGLVRDVVDSRRNVASFFLLVAAIVLVSYAVPSTTVRAYAVSFWVVAFLLIIADSIVLGRRIRRTVAERFPNDTTRGLVWYGVQRSTMIRRWRMPAARVKVGDQI